MARDQKILDRHLRHWRARGLLSPEQEAQLRAASAELAQHATGTVVRTALALLGGGLLLAGLTLILAENWEALHRSVKLGGWAALQAALVLGAHRLGQRWPDRPALARALALVAGGWMLAGIALVSQIYQLDSRPPNGVWFWLVLVLPSAWLLERRASAAVVWAALLAALTLESNAADSWVAASHGDGPWLWLGVPLLATALVSWLPEPPATLREVTGVWTYAAATLFLLVFGAAQDLDRSDLGRAWALAAVGLLLAAALPERSLPRAWDAWTARALLFATLLPWALAGARYDRGQVAANVAVGLAWIAQLAVCVLVIRAGARAGSTAWVNLGYVGLLAGVLTRYFDFFGDFLEGGAALVLTGGLVLFVLYALERARRHTLGGEPT